MAGFYKMERGWMDHPSFRKEPFTDREAFIWMIENAVWQHEGVSELIPGTRSHVKLERGQLAHSLRFMAEKWGWNVAKVRRYIGKLRFGTLIGTDIYTPPDTPTYTGITVITICNYDKYQGRKIEDGTPTYTPPDTPTYTPIGTNIKNIKKRRIKEQSIGDFENLWTLYGKIGNKQRATKAFEKIKGVDYGRIIEKVGCYQAQCRAIGTEAKYIRHLSTWLNERGWEDEYPLPPERSSQQHRNHPDQLQRGADAVMRGLAKAEARFEEQRRREEVDSS